MSKILIFAAPNFNASEILYTPLSGTVLGHMLQEEGHEPFYYNLNGYFLKKYEHIFRVSRDNYNLAWVVEKCLNYLSDKEPFYFKEELDELITENDYTHALISSPVCGYIRNNLANDSLYEDEILAYAFPFALAKYLKQRFNCKVICGGQAWRNVFCRLVVTKHILPLDPNVLSWIDSYHSTKVNNLDFLENFMPIDLSENPEMLSSFSNYLHFQKNKALQNIEDSTLSYDFILKFYDIPPITNSENKYIRYGSLFLTYACVGKCGFCTNATKEKKPFEVLSLDSAKDLLKYYVEELGYNSFFFKDCAINNSPKFAYDLCNWIVQQNLKIQWIDSVRVKNATKELFEVMSAAGCRALGWGCESMSDRMLTYIRKGVTVEEITQAMTWSHEAGIWNFANFIFSMPSETKEDRQMTYDWLVDNKDIVDYLALNAYTERNPSPFLRESEYFNVERIGKRIRYVGDTRSEEQIFRERIETLNKFRNEIYKVKMWPKRFRFPALFVLYDMLGTKEKVNAHIIEHIKNIRKNRALKKG